MSEPEDRESRMAETVRQIVSQRERAPRSPALERAFKRLIWRYSRALREDEAERSDRETELFE